MRPTTTPALINTATVDIGNGRYTITNTYQYDVVTEVNIADLQAQKDAIEQTIQQLPVDANNQP